MVILFLSGINLSILLPLNLAIYRIGNTPNILCPRCKEQDESFLLLQIVQNYSRLHQPTNIINLNYTMIVSEPSQWKLHLNCKIAKISNFTCERVSRLNELQDTATDLGSKDTFLRAWKPLLNYNWNLNIQFNSFGSPCKSSE